MFNQGSRVAVLESKLNIYEDLSREMLTKLEAAVEKISEGNNRIAQILTKHDERIEQSINNRIAQILTKHDERIEQSMKTDTLIIKMIDELKEESENDHKVIHERIDRLQAEIKAFSKFRWQVGGVLVVVGLLISAGSILPLSLTPQPQQGIIERQ
jgi:Zn-dependent M16 (insulinase) family peptidase